MNVSSMASEDIPALREVFADGLRGNHANSKGREAPGRGFGYCHTSLCFAVMNTES